MAYRPGPSEDGVRRKAAQQAYETSPTVAAAFGGITRIVLDLQFFNVNGWSKTSPYRRVFDAEMQAYFRLQCPDHGCSGGGFDLEAAVATAVSKGSLDGEFTCGGRHGSSACPVSLLCQITASLD